MVPLRRFKSNSPQSPALDSCLLLEPQEEVLVLHVRRDGHDLRVALAQQLGADHHVPDVDVREGTGSCWLAVAPHKGWRHVLVTARRAASDFAHAMRWLAD